MKRTRLPTVTRTYQNHHLDSTRWRIYSPRDDDIIISTSYKAGTTWTQMIVALLIFQDTDFPAPVMEMAPWIGFRPMPLDDVRAILDAQTHRRFIKSHLALDGQPYYEQVKYICVGRSPLDVFMSLLNHYGAYTEGAYEDFNDTPGRVGDPFPRFEDNIPKLWDQWIKRGWFDWEPEGYPYWSHMHHARTWWEFRHLPNILHVHYNDMKADLAGQMQRIAAYLDIDVAEDKWPTLVQAATFDSMKNNSDNVTGEKISRIFEGGSKRFINKGTNERWRGILTDENLKRYEEVRDKEMEPACARWLEAGSLVSGDPKDV